ncbi:hypothetical protein [Archangium primigenium]|uniref:hypothetical protein n=1 Tax=[Archangium] primigenium TaxID=2792470 RepID=UPI001957E61C|nr:hypothetical protein [Archangium primigenium]MBM7119342.1 hypothetical protein [Archangium primigenium]
MAHTTKPRAEYGGTSEQRQRELGGDNFEEREPQTPEEIAAARGSPEEDGHQVEHLELLPHARREPSED